MLTDVYVVVMPDNVSMAAMALVAGASGAAIVKTTVLMSSEEVDEATRKTPDYRPPVQ